MTGRRRKPVPGSLPGTRPFTGRRYVLHVDGEQVDLPSEWVLGWVYGVAAARGEISALAALDPDAPEDTRRVHALQIGHAAGWFEYLYVAG